jgi:predicted metal-dependent hydrolase
MLMKTATQARINIGGKQVDYRVIRSKSAKKLRIRVGVRGVEVIQPADRDGAEVLEFVEANGPWIAGQLDRIERFQSIRKPKLTPAGTLLYRGEPLSIRIESHPQRGGANQIVHDGDTLVIVQSGRSSTSPAKSLENWLRKQARETMLSKLADVTCKLRREPGRVYIMGQRTKWGNCSSLQNLSFNWRLIMAPEFVLRYLVTHEAVHLAVPDHSQKFWLTVQSLCPETERAKQWLCAHQDMLTVDLEAVTAMK